MCVCVCVCVCVLVYRDLGVVCGGMCKVIWLYILSKYIQDEQLAKKGKKVCKLLLLECCVGMYVCLCIC